MSNKANLANGYINGSVSAGATSLDLKSGYAGDLPAVPFSATLAPYGQLTSKSNSEIVTVTGVSSDTLTIVRGQRGTTARTFADGDVLAVGVMVEDVVGIDVTVATARTTAAKIGTTADGNYVPCYGDKLNVTFTAGCAVNTPTLNIDGSGAKNIRMADVNVGTTLLSTGAMSVTVPLWFNGTHYQMYGSHLNTNTTYTEITSAEITDGTASTARAITGRRSQEIVTKAIAGVTKTTVGLGNVTNDAQLKSADLDTDSTLAANSDTKVPSQKAVKSYVDTVDYITLGQSSNFTVSSGQPTLNLDKVVNSLGTKLSKSGSTVLVGSGVSLVRVSYTLLAENLSSSADYLYVLLKKNSTIINQALSAKASGAYAGASTTILVPVTAGDTISVVIDFAGGSVSLLTSRPNTMTVEVVK